MEKKSLLCMRWGFVAAFVNVNIGRVNVLPSFVGFFLFWLALRAHEEETGVEKRMEPFLWILMADDLICWITGFSNGVEKLVISVIGIYTLFVLLGEVMRRIEDTQPDVAASIGISRILLVMLLTLNYLAGAYNIEAVNLFFVVAILSLTIYLFVKTFSIVPS